MDPTNLDWFQLTALALMWIIVSRSHGQEEEAREWQQQKQSILWVAGEKSDGKPGIAKIWFMHFYPSQTSFCNITLAQIMEHM
jgi:hypothetical protein